jgi:hypothetical protein
MTSDRRLLDLIAVLHQIADQGIDLLQGECGLGAALQITKRNSCTPIFSAATQASSTYPLP